MARLSRSETNRVKISEGILNISFFNHGYIYYIPDIDRQQSIAISVTYVNFVL